MKFIKDSVVIVRLKGLQNITIRLKKVLLQAENCQKSRERAAEADGDIQLGSLKEMSKNCLKNVANALKLVVVILRLRLFS